MRRATLADAEVVADYNRRLAWESERTRLDDAVLLTGAPPTPETLCTHFPRRRVAGPPVQAAAPLPPWQ